MLSQYEKNQKVLRENYDRFLDPPDDYDEMVEEYAAEHPEEISFINEYHLLDVDFEMVSCRNPHV